MDESILCQPEQQCMEITNGNNRQDSITNGYYPLYRRRQNSLNSKAPPTFAEVVSQSNRADSISPIPVNSKFSLPNRSQPIRSMSSHATTNISMISCPDGLAHALSEQNLRLQQIVHEHKVCGHIQ